MSLCFDFQTPVSLESRAALVVHHQPETAIRLKGQGKVSCITREALLLDGRPQCLSVHTSLSLPQVRRETPRADDRHGGRVQSVLPHVIALAQNSEGRERVPLWTSADRWHHVCDGVQTRR